MFVNGTAAVNVSTLPRDPWQYPPGPLGYYMNNVSYTPLRDPSCREMARYAARYVGWFTAGGFVDECGVQHKSGLHYSWPALSVLNEDEYQTPPGGGVQYTVCWDAWREEIAKVNPTIQLVGPETTNGGPSADVQLAYSLYFMNGYGNFDIIFVHLTRDPEVSVVHIPQHAV